MYGLKKKHFYKAQIFQRASFPRTYYSLLISPVFPLLQVFSDQYNYFVYSLQVFLEISNVFWKKQWSHVQLNSVSESLPTTTSTPVMVLALRDVDNYWECTTMTSALKQSWNDQEVYYDLLNSYISNTPKLFIIISFKVKKFWENGWVLLY